ncbi:hypothetical protein BDZ89DRAFT_249563 [Hymenopellis radicata]|nr:hypothetical protein BDZ89DRAFT_249563 [Hymenopellis radicata]
MYHHRSLSLLTFLTPRSFLFFFSYLCTFARTLCQDTTLFTSPFFPLYFISSCVSLLLPPPSSPTNKRGTG